MYAIGVSEPMVFPWTPFPFVGKSLVCCALCALTPSFPSAAPTGALPGVPCGASTTSSEEAGKATDGFSLTATVGHSRRSKSDSADGLGANRTTRPILRDPSLDGPNAGGKAAGDLVDGNAQAAQLCGRYTALLDLVEPNITGKRSTRSACLYRPFPVVLAAYSRMGGNPCEVPAVVARPHPTGHALRRIEGIGVAVRVRCARVRGADFFSDREHPSGDDVVPRLTGSAARSRRKPLSLQRATESTRLSRSLTLPPQLKLCVATPRAVRHWH
jgi:hypothetical protein